MLTTVEIKRQQLTEVRTAISAILTSSQAYKIGTRWLTRANLSELRKMERELEAELTAMEDGDTLFGVRVPVFDRR